MPVKWFPCPVAKCQQTNTVKKSSFPASFGKKLGPLKAGLRVVVWVFFLVKKIMFSVPGKKLLDISYMD